MRNILIIIMCFYGVYLSAQNYTLSSSSTENLNTLDLIKRHINRVSSSGNAAENDKIIGSAYLEKEFKEGRVFYNKTPIGEYLLRYNVYGEEFEVLNTDETKSAVSKTSEVYVTVEDKKYVFKYFLDDDEKSRFGYFEVLSGPDNEHCTLLKKNKKILSESRKAITSFDVSRPARFVSTEAHYLLFDDKEIIKIRLQNGYISRFFKKRDVDVRSFIKENNLNVKNIEDLKKVVHYCNTLL